jgi:hypothetical protein
MRQGKIKVAVLMWRSGRMVSYWLAISAARLTELSFALYPMVPPSNASGSAILLLRNHFIKHFVTDLLMEAPDSSIDAVTVSRDHGAGAAVVEKYRRYCTFRFQPPRPPPAPQEESTARHPSAAR